MKLRGFGDILGFKQSGIKNFKLADPIHNEDLFHIAEKEIRRIEKSNEDLSKFKALIPSLKVNSDNSSGKLTSINLKFYTQSSTGSFDNVSTTFLESVAWNIFCSYVLSTDNNTSYNFPGSDFNISASSTEYEFAPTSDLQTNDIERIFCSYKIGQAQYSFAYE